MAILASPGTAAYSTTDGRGTDFAAAALPPNGTAVARSTTKAPVKVHQVASQLTRIAHSIAAPHDFCDSVVEDCLTV